MSVQSDVYRHLRELADQFEAPAGFSSRVEIADGQVLMMMSPVGWHDLNAIRVARQLRRQIPESLVAEPVGDAEDAELGTLRRPDVLVVPEAAFLGESLDPREIVLAVEVVSVSNPDNDYVAKSRDYPRMGIQHYLIIDPRDGTCLHQWEPTSDGYANRVHYKFGDVFPIGDWTINSGDFAPYPQEGDR